MNYFPGTNLWRYSPNWAAVYLFSAHIPCIGGFHGGSVVKNPPAMQETQVQSLGQEDPLEEEMATHSSILAWRIPGTEEPGGLQSMGSQRVRRLKRLSTHEQAEGRMDMKKQEKKDEGF